MEGITSVFEMFQVTLLVTFTTVLLPENVAFTRNVIVAPAVGVVVEGVTVRVLTVGQTVTVAVLENVPSAAVMVATPGGLSIVEAAVTKPVFAPTVTKSLSEDQSLFEVTLDVLPSSKVPVAISCFVPPGVSVVVDGVIAIDCSVGFTKNPLQAIRVASNRSAVTEDRIWTFWLFLNITETPSEQVFHPLQAA